MSCFLGASGDVVVGVRKVDNKVMARLEFCNRFNVIPSFVIHLSCDIFIVHCCVFPPFSRSLMY